MSHRDNLKTPLPCTLREYNPSTGSGGKTHYTAFAYRGGGVKGENLHDAPLDVR
jgi:hypothetical protein